MASGYSGDSQPVQAYNYPGPAAQPGVNEQPYNPHEKQPSAPPMMAPTYGAVQPAPTAQYGQPAGSGGGYVNMDSHHGGSDYHKASRVVDCGKIIRLGFIRKVYGILSFQLIITVGMACAFMFSKPARTWIVRNNWFMWVAIVISFIVLIALFYKRNSHPLNMYLLTFWTVAESMMIATVVGIYSCAPEWAHDGKHFVCGASASGQLAIAQAFGITMAIFVVLTIFTMQSKIDFTFLGAGLSVALMVLIFWGMFIWIFDSSWSFYYLYALFGSIIFSLYIVYDTFMICKKLGPDEYILGAISLYLDIINLFVLILALLGGGRRN